MLCIFVIIRDMKLQSNTIEIYMLCFFVIIRDMKLQSNKNIIYILSNAVIIIDIKLQRNTNRNLYVMYLCNYNRYEIIEK